MNTNDSLNLTFAVSSFSPATNSVECEIPLLTLDLKTQQLQLRDSNFLRSTMIDVGTGAQPYFYDINQDSLQDLFISSSCSLLDQKQSCTSSIALYLNTGTAASPQYTLSTPD